MSMYSRGHYKGCQYREEALRPARGSAGRLGWFVGVLGVLFCRTLVLGLNSDALPDIVFANVSEPNRVCVLDGFVGSTCSDVSADVNSTVGLALGDLNRDGNLDAVFANEKQRNRVCLGEGKGSLDNCYD